MHAEIAINRRRWLAPAAWVGLPLLILLVYWPGLGGGFAFDDFPNIVNNPGLHSLSWGPGDLLAAAFSSPASDLQRPLSMLTFAVNVLVSGMDPWTMKLTNVGLHSINAPLVFALVRSLLRLQAGPGSARTANDTGVALFVACCWSLNPINMTAVLYVVQRMEALSHTFVFLGLWLYLAGRKRQIEGRAGGWPRILVALAGCTGAGLLAKESAALLPLYAFLIEACVLRFRASNTRGGRRLAIAYVLLLILPALAAVAWLLPRSLEPGAFSTRNFTLVERLLTEPRVVLDYLRWTLFPNLRELGLYHDDYVISRSLWSPPTTAFAILALGLLAAGAWAGRRVRPLAALGVLWFLAAQAVTASFIPLELVFEHRNYFASLGLCLAVADLLLHSPGDRPLRPLAVGAALAFLGFAVAITHLRAREWSTPFRFAASEAAKRPLSPRTQYDFGRRLVIAGNYDPASPFSQKAYGVLERASRLPESGILAEQALIMLASRTHAPTQAAWWERMQRKLESEPVGPEELGAIAALTRCSLDGNCQLPPDRMLSIFAAALRSGDNPEVLNIYGDYVVNVLGDSDLALRLWREASRLRPREVQYHINCARLLIALRRFDEARAEIAAIASTGRLGQHQAAADSLTSALLAAERATKSPVEPAAPGLEQH